MASASQINHLKLFWVGNKSDANDIRGKLSSESWEIESSTTKSIVKKIKPGQKCLVFFPLWGDLQEFLELTQWPQESYVEVILVRRSDEWHELSHENSLNLINGFNVRGLLEWPLDPEKLKELVRGRMHELEVDSVSSSTSAEGDKDVIQFVKQLSKSVAVEELLLLLDQEIRPYKKMKAPILCYYASGHRRALFFQGHQLMNKEGFELWPQSLRIRKGNDRDQEFLSALLGRPVLSLLSIPLIVHGPQDSDVICPATLYFEHSKSDVEAFMSFIGERLQALTTALDRILLENDLKDAARTWSQTFDGIQDPVAIFDFDHRILRHNHHFFKLFMEDRGSKEREHQLWELVDDSFSQGEPTERQIQVGDQFFNAGLYPIKIVGDSKPSTVVGHFTDVTESIQLQGQMIQNEKMVAVGHLAGNIAHELNNPLTGIRSLAQILLQQGGENEQRLGDIKEIEHAAERCQDIINNLLEFSQPGWEETLDTVGLNEIVNKTLPLLKTALKNHICNVDLAKQVSLVSVEVRLMQQVVFNLVNNACQAMGDSGQLTISTGVNSGEGFLAVKDSGPGISKEDQAKIFESFYTTKKQGQGTGLGLSMSRKIVEKFGGRIELQSELGQGSTFTIFLPLVESVSS